jgi:hypothetical protein
VLTFAAKGALQQQHSLLQSPAVAAMVYPVDEQALQLLTKSGLSEGHLRCLSAILESGEAHICSFVHHYNDPA